MAPSRDDPNQGRLTSRVDDSLVAEVIRVVAVHSNQEPENLPPLNNTVDPDALDDIFEPRTDGTPRRGGIIEFTYAGYDVRITGNQEVEVEPFVDWR